MCRQLPFEVSVVRPTSVSDVSSYRVPVVLSWGTPVLVVTLRRDEFPVAVD